LSWVLDQTVHSWQLYENSVPVWNGIEILIFQFTELVGGNISPIKKNHLEMPVEIHPQIS
jgi:hypothetical protein